MTYDKIDYNYNGGKRNSKKRVNYVILVNNNSKKTHLDSNFYQKRIDPLGKSFLLNVKTFIPEGTYSALFKVMCVVV